MYKLLKDDVINKICAILKDDSTSIPLDENNTDYQAYLKWLADGNTPTPADGE
jgi:hypothetical protein